MLPSTRGHLSFRESSQAFPSHEEPQNAMQPGYITLPHLPGRLLYLGWSNLTRPYESDCSWVIHITLCANIKEMGVA